MAPEWDVVVVGAGPSGSTTAALLATAGFRVALIDRCHFPRPKACAEYMSPGVTAVLRRLGLERVVEAAQPCFVSGMDIMSPGGKSFRVEYGTPGRRSYASTLSRDLLDTALLDHARAQGAEVMEGVVAKQVLTSNGVVSGVECRRHGEPLRLEAALTIAADGNRSVLARSLGLAARAHWPVRMGLVAHYRASSVDGGDYGRMVVGTDGYCGIAPLPGGKLNVATVVRLDALRRSGLSPTAYFEQYSRSDPRLAAVLDGATRLGPVRGVGPVGSRSRHGWAPGALLVGDAAGFFDPFTGEGIHRALVSAELAAGVARGALERGDVSGQALSPYDALRRNAFGRKHAVSALIQLFVQYPRLMEYALPRLSSRPVPAQTLGDVLGDLSDAAEFLRPSVLWSALRP